MKMASRAGLNRFAGRIWPAGRSLETPALISRRVVGEIYANELKH